MCSVMLSDEDPPTFTRCSTIAKRRQVTLSCERASCAHRVAHAFVAKDVTKSTLLSSLAELSVCAHISAMLSAMPSPLDEGIAIDNQSILFDRWSLCCTHHAFRILCLSTIIFLTLNVVGFWNRVVESLNTANPAADLQDEGNPGADEEIPGADEDNPGADEDSPGISCSTTSDGPSPKQLPQPQYLQEVVDHCLSARLMQEYRLGPDPSCLDRVRQTVFGYVRQAGEPGRLGKDASGGFVCVEDPLEDGYSTPCSKCSSLDIVKEPDGATFLYCGWGRFRIPLVKTDCAQCRNCKRRFTGVTHGVFRHSDKVAFTYEICKLPVFIFPPSTSN